MRYAHPVTLAEVKPGIHADPPEPGASRPDGWPRCPGCGEDELYCLRFDLYATGLQVGDELGCYRCRGAWQVTAGGGWVT